MRKTPKSLRLILQGLALCLPARAQAAMEEHRAACEAKANARQLKEVNFNKRMSCCLDRQFDMRMTLTSFPAENPEGFMREEKARRLTEDSRREFVMNWASTSALTACRPKTLLQLNAEVSQREANARKYTGQGFKDYVAGCTSSVQP